MHPLIALLAIAAAQDRAVTFMYQPDRQLQTVHVVGQFNNWDRTTHPLALLPDGKTWKGTFNIAPGAYQYLFVENSSRWLPDPKAPPAGDANGNTNSLLIVEPPDYDVYPAKLGDGILTMSAIAHRADRRDSVRLDEKRAAVWLRTRKGDAKDVFVEAGKSKTKGAKARSDELYDFWRCEIPVTVTSYRFLIDEGAKAVPFGDFKQNFTDYPLPSPPAWVQDAVFYQIFPDRFRNGDSANDPKDVQPWGTPPTGRNWMGGDLAGIRQGLTHLKELGITGLYLNPIFVSPSNHGYDIYDYFTVNPRFGSNDDLKALVSEAHAMDCRVMLDGVFNHSGVEFRPFKDIRERGAESPYRNWYTITRWPLQVQEGQQTYRTFAGVTSMPKLNTENPEVRTFINDVGTRWIRDAGIDGWRLDVADEVSHTAWKEFRKAVKAAKPDAYILGEVWGDAHEWLQGDEHDAVMNYRWRKAVLDFLAYRTLKPSGFDTELKRIRDDYPAAVLNSMFNLLGSHDTERVATIFKGDKDRQSLAVLLQFTYPGVPSIYYGDEIGMEGGKDPDDRRCMIWEKQLWDANLFDLHKELISLRKLNEPLRRGSYRTRVADDKSGLFAFDRTLGKNTLEVVLNTSDQTVHYVRAARGTMLVSRKATLGASMVTLKPFGFAVLTR
jgi:glycosidase